MLTMDAATKIFKILRQPECKYLTQVCCFNYSSVQMVGTKMHFGLYLNGRAFVLYINFSCYYFLKLCFYLWDLDTGRLQTCSSRAFDNPSWVGIPTEHTGISRKIWYVCKSVYVLPSRCNIYTLILFLFFSCIFDLFLFFSRIFDLFYIVHIPRSVFWFHC